MTYKIIQADNLRKLEADVNALNNVYARFECVGGPFQTRLGWHQAVMVDDERRVFASEEAWRSKHGYVCKDCDSSFASEHGLKIHRRKKHDAK